MLVDVDKFALDNWNRGPCTFPAMSSATPHDIRPFDPFISRAALAYLHTTGYMPAGGERHEIGGLEYVIVTDARGPAACYRITVDGRLKRLRRWPAGLAGE